MKTVSVILTSAALFALLPLSATATAQVTPPASPAATAGSSANATPAERRMATFAQGDTAYGEALLERLVNQNSGTLNADGVRAVRDMMVREFEALGFTTEWEDMSAVNRAGNLIATHRGNGRGKRILMIGHLDTVFEPSSPFQTYRREGTRAFGPGVGDDKGGLVVIIAALRAMQDAGTLRNADIQVVLTGDEEEGGRPLATSRARLIAAGQWADIALEYENLVRDEHGDYGTVARRSATNWTLRTHGRTGHSSTIFTPNMGYGAIYEMARILDSFRRELPEENLTFNASLALGGTPATLNPGNEDGRAAGKTNIVPEEAVVRGDFRTLTPEQDARVRARMQAIVANGNLPGTTAEITIDEGYPPMAPTDGNRAVLARFNAVNRDLGLPEMAEIDPLRRGAADSGFVAPYVDTLGGLGVAGAGAHADGEWIDLTSIPLMATRSAVMISRASRERR